MGEWRGVELTGLTLSEPRPGELRLRPYRPADVGRTHAAMQDRSMHEFLPLPDPYTETDARAFCLEFAPGSAERGEGVALAMVAGDDLIVGGANLVLPGPRSTSAEIGYSVHAAARGRGYAARAARVLAAWAFAHGGVRVEIRTAVGNLASQRSALRAGFGLEGVRRHEVVTPDGPVDGATFVRRPRDSGNPVPPWLPEMTDVHDDVVTLRTLTAADFPVLAAEMADPESMRWNIGLPPSDVEAAARGAARQSQHGWLVGPGTRVLIVDRHTGEGAGILELRLGGPPGVVELGYVVLPRFRGRGLTTRALRLFSRWAFDVAGVARLELGADADNVGSQTVAERAGFRCEGRFAGRLLRADGTYADEVRFGLTR